MDDDPTEMGDPATWKALWTPDGRDTGDRAAILVATRAALDQLRSVHQDFGPHQQSIAEAFSNSFIVLSMLAEMLDDRGASDFKISLIRRRAGKPNDRLAAAIKGHEAAAIVERLQAEGVHQKEAIFQATKATGLGRTEIYEWLGYRKRTRQMTPAEIVDLYIPRDNSENCAD